MAKNSKKKSPREIPTKEEHFMSIAFWTATQSRDPHRQEGAVLAVGKHLIAAEPNGVPDGIKDDDFSWERLERVNYVERAIENVLWSAAGSWHDLTKATLYVTNFPTRKCMRSAARAKIDKLVYFPLHEKLGLTPELSEKEVEIVKKIARFSNITLDEFSGNLNWMRDQMERFVRVGVFK